jgi:hypothetical protein
VAFKWRSRGCLGLNCGRKAAKVLMMTFCNDRFDNNDGIYGLT